MIRRLTIASVILALAPVAGAQPRDYDEHHQRDYDHDRDRDRDWHHRDRDRDRDMGNWMTIGASSLDRGGVKYMIGATAGRFHQLRIQATRGRPLVRRVEVRFVDDSLQTIDIGRRLDTGEELDADLNCRECTISSVTVIGRPDRYSHVAIAAR